MEISRMREGKVSEFITGYRTTRVGTRYRDIVFIGNRKSLSRARTKGAASRVRAREERRVTTSRGERVVAFSSRFPLAFKGPPVRGDGKKERKRAFKNERGSIP